jgi:heat shock protein HtpX
MGLKIVQPSTRDAREMFLLQKVAELSRQAGLGSSPEVAVFESPEPNAFATGATKNRSLVAVSTGLLNRMNQDEVAGVLGHEIAHIANGDMVTMTLLQGIVNAFVMFFARILAFAVSQTVDERSRGMVRFIVTIVLEIGLSFLGLIVVAGFSRWREFRADAGGAKLAGRSNMIAALQKLASSQGLINGQEPSQNVAFLQISGKSGGLMQWMASHPPLTDRIKRLQEMR